MEDIRVGYGELISPLFRSLHLHLALYNWHCYGTASHSGQPLNLSQRVSFPPTERAMHLGTPTYR